MTPPPAMMPASMERPTFNALLQGLPVLGRTGDGSVRVTTIVTDSRRVIPGALFFALPGLRSNGHAFLDDVIARGAAAIISGEPVAGLPAVAAAQVADPRRMLAEIARRFYGRPEEALRLVGVTGTNGKTTVSTLLRHLLQDDGSQWGLVGTVRYHLGRRTIPSYKTTPDSADLAAFFRQMADAGCAGACLEVSSHALHQERVHGFRFEVAAFTNLTRDHVDYHGDLAAYLDVKTMLFDGRNGAVPDVCVINVDDPSGRVLCVFGCGGDRDRGKRPAMTQAVADLAHLSWATADNPRKEPLDRIFADMREGLGPLPTVEFVADRRDAIGRALAAAKAGDCVVIAGKGHETTQEFADTVVPFDDRQVVREILELRRGVSA